jgi:hypothetical protein
VSQPRPVPGPVAPRPAAPGPAAVPAPGPGTPAGAGSAGRHFAGLAERPVSEHVAVFEAEHDRLQRELATIDQL